MDLSWRMDSPCLAESTEESAVETDASKYAHVEKLQAVNKLLTLDGHKPINRTMQVSWVDASERTKRFYTSKMSEVVSTLLELVAPNDAGLLWRSLKESSQINERYNEPSSSEASLLTALVESYKQATHHSTRKQILSVMADKLSFKDLEQLIPGLSRYRFHSARLHRLQYGVGAPLPQMPMAVREKVDPVRLEHFIDFITSQHVIQDLPFGRRKLKLSNGEGLEIPNVVRLLIPSRLVNQYYQYCQEMEFSCPLGRSTLFKILSESCGASIRRCMQGLDNYLADGARSFDELIDVVDKLSEVGLDGNTAVCLKDALKDGKQYLKGDYKVHVSSESTIPDHCRAFSLSDVENSVFQLPCNHEHSESCGRCLKLTQVLHEIQKQVEKTQFLCEDDKDETLFLVQKAKQAISEWKAHQLRSVHQDVSRLDVLQSLNSSRVLIVQDFAMKFLPSRYREAQSDFFGKRGISWHISVCQRKVTERLEAQTFIHILESGLQDSETVVLIMEHVLRSLKEQHPEITAAYFRQDNAGCYHSSCTILSARVLSTRTGVQVKQIDFSDPQGGKGSCDRKAAQVKAHIKSYVNEGNSVTTPRELKTAIESRGGIPGVRVAVVETSNGNTKTYKLESINTLNNFTFSDRGFYAFRAYSIGPGKFFDWKTFEAVPEESEFSWLENVSFGDGDFSAVFQRRAQSKITADVSETKQTNRLEKKEDRSDFTDSSFQCSDSSDSNNQASAKIFSCPEEGCTKSFVRYSALERHCEYGVHIRSLEKVTLQDRAKLSYAQHLEEGQTKELSSVSLSGDPHSPLLNMGWALKSKPKTARFSEKQKSFLESKFLEGEKSSKKTTGEEVAKKMRKARDANNQRLFSIDEFLTPSQISSYFSRFAAKRKQLSESEYQAHENEDMLVEVRNDLMKSLEDESRGHPLVHGDLQLCQMTKEELSSLKMTTLKAICKEFDVHISGRRKEPFVNGVVSIVESCSCKAAADSVA